MEMETVHPVPFELFPEQRLHQTCQTRQDLEHT